MFLLTPADQARKRFIQQAVLDSALSERQTLSAMRAQLRALGVSASGIRSQVHFAKTKLSEDPKNPHLISRVKITISKSNILDARIRTLEKDIAAYLNVCKKAKQDGFLAACELAATMEF